MPGPAASYYAGVVGANTYIPSLHPRPSVHDKVSHSTGGNPVGAEHSRSKAVNREKQSPTLRCEYYAYGMNGSG